ncbi:MAG: phage holin, LLH family [Clostridia bacterium]|nr:phage holin, LLH family [Clostridia bacterium]
MKKTSFFAALLLLSLTVLPCIALAEGSGQAGSAIDLTPVLQAVITLLAALITYRLIPWIRARTTEQQQANLSAMVSTLVYAAEQLFGANSGADKLNYVTDILRKRGYDVDSQEVLATIEAAVHQMQPKAADQQADKTRTASEQTGADEPSFQ